MPNRLPKSYVLPSMGLLMASVPRADPETHRIIVQNASPAGNHSVYATTLLKYYASLNPTAYLHEWGHIIQNVMYPYLYLRSVRELGTVDFLLSKFQQDERPAISTNWSVSRELIESMSMDIALFRIVIAEDETVSIDAPSAGPRGRNDISEVDLIEEANSIFEFKVELGDYGSGEDYHNWLKKGSRGYTRVYRLLSKLLGRQYAYELLPPLVTASYYTTYPVTAFASLLEHILRHRNDFNVASPTEAEAYLVDRLIATFGTESTDIPKLRRLAADDTFAFVGERAMRQYISESEHHPLNLLAQRVWTARSAAGRGWIYHPHQFIRRGGHSVRNEIADLQPPFTFLVYDSDEVPLGFALFLLSDIYRDRKVSSQVDPECETEFATYLEMLLFRRVLIQSLLRDPQESRGKFCHHEECDYFNSGLCDEYLRIPDVASDCAFPIYVVGTIKRRYSKESNSLERIQENA
jgi:hypothetical protein